MNWLQRTELLIGKEMLENIQNKKVLVIGLGGVGSYTIESLVRSGIHKLIVIDYDTIDITNLNRQIMTDITNIGKNKADAIEERIHLINPNCEIIKIKERITKENIGILFNQSFDYVVDACDTIETKKELILECIKRKIKFISVMGTGNKLDPTKLEITDIRKTSYDPIAKIIRKMIKEKNIKEKIPVICSKEQPIKNSSNIIGSNSFIPAIAGLLCTSFIINDILKEGSTYENK